MSASDRVETAEMRPTSTRSHADLVPTALVPTSGDERIVLLDSLRGFALGGVLLANLGAFSLYFHLSPAERAALPTAAFDSWARMVLAFLVAGKFMTLFSLLFGLGFAVQLMRAEQRGADGRRLYVRRLLVLLLFGILHWLLWWGDVLRLYAVLGLGLLLFRRASPRTLLWTGLLLACLGSAMLGPILNPLLAPLQAALPSPREANARALATFSGNSWTALVRYNPIYDGLYLARNWYEPLFILGRLLLGFWAGRALIFHEPASNRALLRRIFVVSVALGLIGNAVSVLRTFYALEERAAVLGHPIGVAMLEVLTSTGSIALGAAYATGVALLFLRQPWRSWLERLAPVGRMALTNYLLQTAAGIALFYGIGLGLGPRWGVPGRLVTFVLLFAAQTLASHWWLGRFRFGPAEWLWRSLTYGRAQPMRLPVPRRR